jgi:hypothetical protein
MDFWRARQRKTLCVFGAAGSARHRASPRLYQTGPNVHGRTFLGPATSVGRKATDSLRRFLLPRTEIAIGNSGLVVCDRVVNVIGSPKTS